MYKVTHRVSASQVGYHMCTASMLMFAARAQKKSGTKPTSNISLRTDPLPSSLSLHTRTEARQAEGLAYCQTITSLSRFAVAVRAPSAKCPPPLNLYYSLLPPGARLVRRSTAPQRHSTHTAHTHTLTHTGSHTHAARIWPASASESGGRCIAASKYPG